MGLKRQTYLHDTPAKQDQANGADQAENEIAQIVDHCQRIVYRKCRDSAAAEQRRSHYRRTIVPKSILYLVRHRQSVLISVSHVVFPPFS